MKIRATTKYLWNNKAAQTFRASDSSKPNVLIFIPVLSILIDLHYLVISSRKHIHVTCSSKRDRDVRWGQNTFAPLAINVNLSAKHQNKSGSVSGTATKSQKNATQKKTSCETTQLSGFLEFFSFVLAFELSSSTCKSFLHFLYSQKKRSVCKRSNSPYKIWC